jgi:hypothetical protein
MRRRPNICNMWLDLYINACTPKTEILPTSSPKEIKGQYSPLILMTSIKGNATTLMAFLFLVLIMTTFSLGQAGGCKICYFYLVVFIRND